MWSVKADRIKRFIEYLEYLSTFFLMNPGFLRD